MTSDVPRSARSTIRVQWASRYKVDSFDQLWESAGEALGNHRESIGELFSPGLEKPTIVIVTHVARCLLASIRAEWADWADDSLQRSAGAAGREQLDGNSWTRQLDGSSETKRHGLLPGDRPESVLGSGETRCAVHRA